MQNTGFSPWPSFTQEEADAVQRVLLSNKVNYWTGNEGREFEKEFARWCGTEYAIVVSNGTVALDLAWNALGVGKGDEVIVTSRTFLASASSIVNAGATPVFVDVDRDSQNITASTVEKSITPKTKAICTVHLAGWPCDMDSIMDLADQFGLKVVEDCAQAHGAKYKGKSVGSIGHIGTWSFCQDKIMTTGGEGGMITTNNALLWEKIWSLKDHGKSWDVVYQHKHDAGFRWLHDSFGSNARMTEMQAAIGRIQLNRMPAWHESRVRHAQTILHVCNEFEALRAPEVPEHIDHAWYKVYVFVRPESLKPGWSRDRIMFEIRQLGVPCSTGSCSEVYLEKAFDGTGYRPKERLAIARELGETSLIFQVHPTLSERDLMLTSDVIAVVMKKASRNRV